VKLKNIELPVEDLHNCCQRWQVTEFALLGSVLREDFHPDSIIIKAAIERSEN
jgi:uncharacterized protein